eukprot:TRINITY_DN69071_c0_g1_i1.p1 TRINITY_DN69071_c0_g1~~TRINITY_DN69071_c0_g1_i1.p1  ORF type:complete len:230 (-),score=30.32 TRINITY_DN69071_c0_g1_i1:174-863(-)
MLCDPCGRGKVMANEGLQLSICDQASEILSGRLFLGSAASAREVLGENKLKITHVLNVSDACVLMPGAVRGVEVEWVPMADDGCDDVFGSPQSEAEYEAALAADPTARPRGAWWRCRSFIEKTLLESNDVRLLVHCALGVNRSATIVTAWLMQERRWSAQRALQYVERRRRIVNPAPRHLMQLEAFQRELGVEAPEVSGGSSESPQLMHRNEVVWILRYLVHMLAWLPT